MYITILICIPHLIVPPDPKIAESPRVVNPPTRMVPIDPLLSVFPPLESAIAGTGAIGIYLMPKAPYANIIPAATKILAGNYVGPPHQSSAS